MLKVVIGKEIAAALRERLAQTDIAVEVLEVDQHGEDSILAEADAAIRWGISGDGFQRVLERAPRLRWVHSPSAGVESWPINVLKERQITLTNAAGVYALPIAEWVLTAMLMIVKQAHTLHDAQREHRWTNRIELDELTDKTLLILGTGGIGQEVAHRAAAFGMRVWGSNRSGNPVADVERIVVGDAWRDLLPEADFIVVTLPLTDETRGMLGTDELGRCKPTAWLINVGRGATIDEPALLEAIRDGRLGGAALDAWVEEPLPPEHPAWTTPNLIIWPHHSGSSPHSVGRGLDLVVENIRRFTQDQPLLNIVDLEAGY